MMWILYRQRQLRVCITCVFCEVRCLLEVVGGEVEAA